MSSLSRHLMLSAGIAAGLFTGCATKVSGLKADPSFSYDNVMSGRMVVGGVVSLSGETELSEISSYANALRTQFQEERGDYTIGPVASVMSALGNDAYADFINDYKNMGAISDDKIATLKEKVKSGRYVIFARIEADDVAKGRDVVQEKDKKGKVTGETIVKTVTRTMTVSLDIYDLEKGIRAWNASLTKSDVAKSQYRPEKDNVIIAIVKVAKDATETDDEKYPYPEAPDQTKVLGTIFKGFAENMPKS